MLDAGGDRRMKTTLSLPWKSFSVRKDIDKQIISNILISAEMERNTNGNVMEGDICSL